MARAFLQCESHPGRSLTDHLLNVSGRLKGPLLSLVGLCHDLGKATEYFQNYLCGRTPIDYTLKRHSLLGAEILLELLLCKIDRGDIPVEQAALAYLFVRCHHGKLVNLVDALSGLGSTERQLLAKQLESVDRMPLIDWLATQGYYGRQATDRDRTGIRVRTLRRLKEDGPDGLMARFQGALCAFGRFIEADRDSAAGYTADFFQTKPKYSINLISDYRKRVIVKHEGVNPILASARTLLFERSVSQSSAYPPAKGGLWSLTSPTGSGKTIAAMGWAVNRREARIAAGRPNCPVIYALPFTSVIDQNANVLREILGQEEPSEDALSIHHHLAEPGPLFEIGEESLARNWTEGWRADVVCTTFVQVVNALFHGTCWDARRMTHLADGILILDEIQGVPAHLWPVIAEALRSLVQHFGTDILLMTATQPALLETEEVKELVPEELANKLSSACNRYDLSVDIAVPLKLEELADKICLDLSHNEAESCLVILNTIDEALRLFDLIAKADWSSTYQLFHLSTNLRPKDRTLTLRTISQCNHSPHIVISTQVVEAGVDLSFDVVYRALAPFDSIVQAAGRSNRHGVRRRGIVRVIEPQGGTATKIYGSVHIDVARSICCSIEGRTVPEPELSRWVKDYFATLKTRISKDKSVAVMDAVRMMEFASLRGEGPDERDKNKCLLLIEDQIERIPHYIETDETDVRLYSDFKRALSQLTRGRLRFLRNQVGTRIVEVQKKRALGEPDKQTGFVHVPLEMASQVYSSQTGWRRQP